MSVYCLLLSVYFSRRRPQDGNKALSATLYKMLLAANGTPSLSAANAAIKGCTEIDSAMVRGNDTHTYLVLKHGYAVIHETLLILVFHLIPS